jgi:hypothetical protein
VTSTTTATLTAAFAGVTRTAALTITAGAPSTPPAPALIAPPSGASVTLPVILDWGDVAGAASYGIQVDDSSSFSAPRVIEQTVAASQLSVSSLAARQHWWRVRAVNSAGTTGSWSSVRTFTPQAAPPGPAATLTVTATGRSGARVTSSPAGINVSVGNTGSASFAGGTRITLSVSNGRDAIWSGACSSGGSKTKTCVFTISANASVTANVQ